MMKLQLYWRMFAAIENRDIILVLKSIPFLKNVCEHEIYNNKDVADARICFVENICAG